MSTAATTSAAISWADIIQDETAVAPVAPTTAAAAAPPTTSSSSSTSTSASATPSASSTTNEEKEKKDELEIDDGDGDDSEAMPPVQTIDVQPVAADTKAPSSYVARAEEQQVYYLLSFIAGSSLLL
jgi:hypothetical protein